MTTVLVDSGCFNLQQSTALHIEISRPRGVGGSVVDSWLHIINPVAQGLWLPGLLQMAQNELKIWRLSEDPLVSSMKYLDGKSDKYLYNFVQEGKKQASYVPPAEVLVDSDKPPVQRGISLATNCGLTAVSATCSRRCCSSCSRRCQYSTPRPKPLRSLRRTWAQPAIMSCSCGHFSGIDENFTQ